MEEASSGYLGVQEGSSGYLEVQEASSGCLEVEEAIGQMAGKCPVTDCSTAVVLILLTTNLQNPVVQYIAAA